MSGLFITFEGVEGCGKTTQIARLRDHLESRGFSVVVTREPGGAAISEAIRTILLDPAHTEMAPMTELLLYAAARAQHVAERIQPALDEGRVVLCDRFADSTTAYQGGARGIELSAIEFLNRFAMAECVPDLTLLLDLTPEAGFGRTRVRTETAGKHDRFEEEDLNFHRRVREAFHAIARREPERVRTIDADRPAELIHEEIKRIVDACL